MGYSGGRKTAAVLVGRCHPHQSCGSSAYPSLPWGVLGSHLPPHSASIVPLLSPVLGDVRWAQVGVLVFTLLLAVLPHSACRVGFHLSILFSQVFWVPDLGQSGEVGGEGTSLRLFLLLLFYLLEKPLLLASVQLRS